jgi:effector-binding domain-containing protein
MMSEPKVVERAPQPYAAIKKTMAMQELSAAAAASLPAVFGWVVSKGAPPQGAPFFKYDLIDMPRRMDIEFGVPTATRLAADDQVMTGVLPGGRYASLIFQGRYDRLIDANRVLLEWIAQQGLTLDMAKTPEGDTFGSRLEIYLTDPQTEPDPEKLETEVAFRLAD